MLKYSGVLAELLWPPGLRMNESAKNDWTDSLEYAQEDNSAYGDGQTFLL